MHHYRTPQRTEAVKVHPLLSLASTALIAAGAIGLFAPQLLTALLPPEAAQWTLQAAPLVLGAGIVLTVYHVIRIVRAAAKAAAASPGSAADQSGIREDIAGDDPVARQLDWKPLKPGGANFKTHKLVDNARGRVEIRATRQMQAFSWVFVLAGCGIAAGMGYKIYLDESWLVALFPVAFGGVFAAVGIAMLRLMAAPRIFDLQLGWYWKGRTQAQRPQAVQQLKDATRLSEVHAIQLLAEYCRGDKRSYYSYEMNLVLSDGSRVNVIDHGNKSEMLADAEMLGRVLGVPVWSRVAQE